MPRSYPGPAGRSSAAGVRQGTGAGAGAARPAKGCCGPRAMRLVVAVAGWFSVLMTAASVQQYLYYKGDTPDDRRMRSLQVPSMAAHPIFAVAALLLVHVLRPGFARAAPAALERGLTEQEPTSSDGGGGGGSAPPLSTRDFFVFCWAFVGSAAVTFLYARSLDPAVGLPFPASLVDWARACFYFATTMSVAGWWWRAREGTI